MTDTVERRKRRLDRRSTPTPKVIFETELAAKQLYDEGMAGLPQDSALENLRYFCSLAMRANEGQDWLDVEPFFDAVEAELAAAKWSAKNQRLHVMEQGRIFAEQLAAERTAREKAETALRYTIDHQGRHLKIHQAAIDAAMKEDHD